MFKASLTIARKRRFVNLNISQCFCPTFSHYNLDALGGKEKSGEKSLSFTESYQFSIPKSRQKSVWRERKKRKGEDDKLRNKETEGSL